jgi:hypothetical protein
MNNGLCQFKISAAKKSPLNKLLKTRSARDRDHAEMQTPTSHKTTTLRLAARAR